MKKIAVAAVMRIRLKVFGKRMAPIGMISATRLSDFLMTSSHTPDFIGYSFYTALWNRLTPADEEPARWFS